MLNEFRKPDRRSNAKNGKINTMEQQSKDRAGIVPPPKSFKIKIYFIAIEIIGVVVPIIISALIYYFPTLFYWLHDPKAGAISLFVIGITHAILFGLHEKTKKNIYYNATQYAYGAFFIYFIFLTGGVTSPFIFLLVFPILTSAVYLDRRTTRDVGIFLTVALGLLIFIHYPGEIDGSLITQHIIQTVLFGMIAYFLHHIVIESLRQKYEKEEAGRRLNEVVQIDALKSDFLTIAQHQLRTPLTGVKWSLESLSKSTGLPQTDKDTVNDGLARVEDSLVIVNDMLKTVENNKKPMKVEKRGVDLAEIVRIIILELEFLAQRKEVTVNVNIPDHLNLSADPKLIKAAIHNVIDNSLKYSPKASVSITLNDSEKEATLVVADTGIGILPSDMPYIFERLYRGKNALTVEPNESGFGLYMSKKIFALHGGNISLESEFNKGTKVTMVLPKSVER